MAFDISPQGFINFYIVEPFQNPFIRILMIAVIGWIIYRIVTFNKNAGGAQGGGGSFGGQGGYYQE